MAGPAREDDYWKYNADEDPELEGGCPPSRSETFHSSRQKHKPDTSAEDYYLYYGKGLVMAAKKPPAKEKKKPAAKSKAFGGHQAPAFGSKEEKSAKEK